jgi:hypothetical protein
MQPILVAPAQAGVQGQRQNLAALDSRLRGNDEIQFFPTL